MRARRARSFSGETGNTHLPYHVPMRDDIAISAPAAREHLAAERLLVRATASASVMANR